MSRKTVTIMFSVVFIASVLLVPGVSWDKATTEEVSAVMTRTGVIPPYKQWIAENILHIRGQTEIGEITGDLEGTYTAVGNTQLDLLTGEGQNVGKGVLILTGAGRTGVFECIYVGKLSDFGDSFILWTVAHGISGDVEGMKLMGTATWSSADGSYDFEGLILDPHGE